MLDGKTIAQRIAEHYPNPKTELIYANEMQLAIAVTLSAQTTDKKVNEITSTLFKKYLSWEALAGANIAELTQDIKGVNFHIGKAQRLGDMAKKVIADFNGKLPRDMASLITLPGVARKSANVIMQELWGIADGVVVDTHITRVSQRLGFTKNTDAVKIEKELMTIIPKEYWRTYSGGIVLHGRYICTARKPKCAMCFLNDVCPSAFTA
jgi:endonuclease-3